MQCIQDFLFNLSLLHIARGKNSDFIPQDYKLYSQRAERCVFFYYWFWVSHSFQDLRNAIKITMFSIGKANIWMHICRHITQHAVFETTICYFILCVSCTSRIFFLFIYSCQMFSITWLYDISHRYPNVSSVKFLQTYTDRFSTKFSLLIIFL